MKTKKPRKRPTAHKREIPQMTPIRSQDGYMVGWFRDEVYGANIHLLWPLPGKALTSGHLSAYYKRTFNMDYNVPDGSWQARCTEIRESNGTGHAHCICLGQWSPTPEHIATLTHETFHALEQILQSRSVPFTLDTSEPCAYLIESITRRCLEMLMGKY